MKVRTVVANYSVQFICLIYPFCNPFERTVDYTRNKFTTSRQTEAIYFHYIFTLVAHTWFRTPRRARHPIANLLSTNNFSRRAVLHVWKIGSTKLACLTACMRSLFVSPHRSPHAYARRSMCKRLYSPIEIRTSDNNTYLIYGNPFRYLFHSI